MAVIDVTTFNGEYDLFELRYQILKDYVDEFIVIEFDTTFSGKDKPCYLDASSEVFYDPISQWPKVHAVKIDESQWSKYLGIAEQSPNTVGAEHWKREFAQKESIKDTLGHLKDEDIVFIGDVDEVWSEQFLKDMHYKDFAEEVVKGDLRVYTYYLNQTSDEAFLGTIAAKYRHLKGKCLNHLRTTEYTAVHANGGWHFTSMGGPDSLRKKLTDSYTQESYATPQVLENIAYNIENGRDFLGRNFTYRVDESQWPQYLKDNREKYMHLLHPTTTETGETETRIHGDS